MSTTSFAIRFTRCRLLLSTELRSADRYWHVRKKKDRIYPKEYTPAVVGMLWTMMAQFQTWFGSDPFLAYGIQVRLRNFVLQSFYSSCRHYHL